MSFWLCMTNEENWNIVKDMNLWGVSERDRKKLERTNVGDPLVFYVKQKKIKSQTIEPQIKGIFKITSDPFFGKGKVFARAQADEVFPWRIKIEPTAIPKKPLKFNKLVPKLQFIKNKKKWWFFLQFSMRTIPRRDFDLIQSEILRE